jgi:hypothetical protein
VAAGAPAPAGLESHLVSCAGCREELATLRRALALADTEMAGLLSAEPSPDLASRIRRSLAESDPATEWRFGWLWPATAAAAVMLVVVAAWQARSPSPLASPEAPVAANPVIPRDSVAPGPEESAESVIPRVASRPALEGSAVPRSTGRPAIAAEPEVLVPPGEGEALLRLVALVHRERVVPAALGAAGEPSPALAEPEPLDIKPIEIVPLDPAGSSGT